MFTSALLLEQEGVLAKAEFVEIVNLFFDTYMS
jgi:hypothetical protein